MRVCRVVPDVPAIDREFDYLVPDRHATRVGVGTIVRVPLHGRNVRGWVVADGVEPSTGETLLEIARVSGVGPDESMIDLCRWAARRWLGPVVTFLRAATPPNAVTARATRRVAPARHTSAPPEPGTDAGAGRLAADVAPRGLTVVEWAPQRDRRPLVEALLLTEGSTLMVTADTARLAPLGQWLQSRGWRVLIDHSTLPASVRTKVWRDASGGACVILAGRVGALAPVPDLGRVVIVDDGDEALAEERAPTWHARDLLVERARRDGIAAVVVATVPSLESLHIATKTLALSRAARRGDWPRIEIVDRRADPPGAGLFSDEITAALRREVDRDRLSLCVLNRRGRVRLLACGACDHLMRWDAETSPAWTSPTEGGGRPRVCPRCAASNLRLVRAGISHLADDLRALLVGASVVEVDTDTEALRLPAGGVAIGTEALLHRREVRRADPATIVFLDFDQELLAPRIRASEQALRLVVRAARVATGRGRVLIQTRSPDHEVLRAAASASPGAFLAAELARRTEAHLPPAVALAEVRGDLEAAEALVTQLNRLEHRTRGVTVLGPAARGEHASVLVSAPDHESLSGALAVEVVAARRVGALRGFVDPQRV